MSLDKQHVMGAAAEAAEPALVSDQAPAGLAPTGFDQAQVIQADREAAAAYWSGWIDESLSVVMHRETLAGEYDDDPDSLVYAFVKHRLAALEASSRQEERLREALEEIVSYADAAERWGAGRVLTNLKQAEVNVWEQVGDIARAALEPPHAKVCTCFARSADECACGAWDADASPPHAKDAADV